MVAYNFKSQFVPPIVAGTKRQTIRADRKRHAFPGEPLQLYTGMRTKQCRLIGRAVCWSVEPVSIDVGAERVECGGVNFGVTCALDRFALSDGFLDWPHMREFWRLYHRDVPQFSGVLIRWVDFEPAPP